MAASSPQPVSVAHAPLAVPRKLTTAEEVKLQLARDYPPGALGWVDAIAWAKNPVQVPLRQIDMTSGDTDWAAARKDKLKVAAFVSKIRSGTQKPVVLIRHPGSPKLFACDGHTRILACTALGRPVTAWVGTSQADDGGWRTVHAREAA